MSLFEILFSCSKEEKEYAERLLELVLMKHCVAVAFWNVMRFAKANTDPFDVLIKCVLSQYGVENNVKIFQLPLEKEVKEIYVSLNGNVMN